MHKRTIETQNDPKNLNTRKIPNKPISAINKTSINHSTENPFCPKSIRPRKQPKELRKQDDPNTNLKIHSRINNQTPNLALLSS